jgi:hypothetical protein
MFDTLAGIIVGLILVLPGFIIADLAEARRAQRPERSDWELVLRALIYALVLQSVVLLTGWTTWLIDRTDLLGSTKPGTTPTWEHHVDAIAIYAVIVIILVPTIIGLLLGWILRRAERRGSLTWFHYALGGRDARDAWDYIFLRYGAGFVLVHLKPGVEGRSPFLVGKFGLSSWAAQTPASSRDIYFEEVWPAKADGEILGEYTAQRGIWIDASQIDAMFFINPPGPPPRFRDWARTRILSLGRKAPAGTVSEEVPAGE